MINNTNNSILLFVFTKIEIKDENEPIEDAMYYIIKENKESSLTKDRKEPPKFLTILKINNNDNKNIYICLNCEIKFGRQIKVNEEHLSENVNGLSNDICDRFRPIRNILRSTDIKFHNTNKKVDESLTKTLVNMSDYAVPTISNYYRKDDIDKICKSLGIDYKGKNKEENIRLIKAILLHIKVNL